MNLEGLRPWGGLTGGSAESADVVVTGIPYDGSAVYRKGAALAPQRIRSLSAAMPPVTEDGRLLTGMRVHDLGDLDAGADIEVGWSKAREQLSRVPLDAFLTVLGGDHCTAISTLSAQVKRHPDVGVLNAALHAVGLPKVAWLDSPRAITAENLRQYASASLSSFKVPTRIEILADESAVPWLGSGKPDKLQLRARLLAGELATIESS